jgi:hypothetical protein
VSEQRLHLVDVVTRFQQVRGQAVAEGLARHPLGDPRAARRANDRPKKPKKPKKSQEKGAKKPRKGDKYII